MGQIYKINELVQIVTYARLVYLVAVKCESHLRKYEN